MTFIKAIAVFVFTLLVTCNGQFLTPDQLREQYDLGYGSRTHYQLSGGRRTDLFNRVNPDYLLRGFFPFWSVVLIGLALIFLAIAVIGLIGYLLGCRRPTAEEIYTKEFGQLTPDDEFLLGAGGITDPEENRTAVNGYYNNTDQRDYRYESSPRAERARIGQSSEDMV